MEPIQQQLSNIRATLQNLSGQEREAAFGILQKIVEECKSTQDLAADTPHASHSSAADGDGISNEVDGSSSYEERKGKIYTDLSRDDHAYYASVPPDRNASLAVQKQETSEAHTLSEEQTEQRFGSTDVESVEHSDESRQQKEPVCAQKERDIHDVVNAVFDVASEVDVITDSLIGDQAAETRKHSSELGESRDNKNSPTIEMENGKMEVVEKNCSSADDAGKIDISKSVDQTFKGENRTLRDDEKTDGVLRCSARGRKTRDEAGKQANEKPITEDKAPPLRTSKRKGRPPKKFASSASDDLSSNLKNQTEKYENEPRPKRRRFPSRYIKEDEDFINSEMEDSKKVERSALPQDQGVKEDGRGKRGKAGKCSKERPKEPVKNSHESAGASGKKKGHVYKCSVCSLTFSHGRPYNRHMKTHNAEPCCCRSCKKEFATLSEFASHVCEKNKLVKISRKCEHCDKKFSSFKKLRLHVKKVHGNSVVPEHFCKFCNRGFVRRISVYRHYKEHVGNKFVCLKCGEIMNTSDEYYDHMGEHRKESNFHCSYCGESFSRHQQYSQHMEAHNKYKCSKCDASFPLKKLYLKHARILHNIKNRTEEKKFSCNQCGKMYQRPGQLEIHQRIHTGEKPYECKICQILFRTNKALLKHQRTNTHLLKAGEKPREKDFLCFLCGRSYSRQSGLHRHMRYHTGLRPYKCPHCDYSCKENSNLKRHISLHFSERQFVCEICGAAFHAKKILETHHVFKHSENKNYSCDECSKSFKTLSELKRHKKCHSGEKHFKCFCGASFNRGCNLRRHMRGVHGSEEGMPPVRRVPLLDVPPEDAFRLKHRRKGSSKAHKEESPGEQDKPNEEEDTGKLAVHVEVYEPCETEFKTETVIPLISYHTEQSDGQSSHEVQHYEVSSQQIISMSYASELISASQNLISLQQMQQQGVVYPQYTQLQNMESPNT